MLIISYVLSLMGVQLLQLILVTKMENKTKKNVPGPYYVDQECIACDAGVLVAENHFKIDEEENLAYVCRQPQTPGEKALCQEAIEACPVEAIHNDGE